MDRTCKFCDKVFKYPSRLKKHLSAKRQCVPALIEPRPAVQSPTTCRFCGRIFSAETHMFRHMRTSCKIAPNARNGTTGMERLYSLTESRIHKEIRLAGQTTRILRLEEQNTKMLALIQEQGELTRELQSQLALTTRRAAGDYGINNIHGDFAGIQTAGDGNTTQIDNRRSKTSITINVFGCESTAHISPAHVRTILTDALHLPALPVAASTAILKTAMLIYSDPAQRTSPAIYQTKKLTTHWSIPPPAGKSSPPPSFSPRWPPKVSTFSSISNLLNVPRTTPSS